jgi:hypothetical protein
MAPAPALSEVTAGGARVFGMLSIVR